MGGGFVSRKPCGEGGEFDDPLGEQDSHGNLPKTVEGEVSGGTGLDLLELPVDQSERISVGQNRKRKWEPTRIAASSVEQIMLMFESYVYSPPSLICEQICWLSNETTKLIDKSHVEFKHADNRWRTIINSWNYDQFSTFYARNRCYKWKQTTDQPYYHSLDTSIFLLEQWFTDQCNMCVFEVPDMAGSSKQVKLTFKECLQWIVDVIFRRVPKVGCFMIQGPSCAGKTWIQEALTDGLLNVGNLANWSRYTGQFPFMDCVNRRVIVWNEAQVSGDLLQREELKLLMEGAMLSVNVKNEKPGKVFATPLIITTNNRIYANDPVFTSRRVVMHCQQSNVLNGTAFCPGQLKLHPIALFKLIKMYKINTHVEPMCVFEPAKNEIQCFDI